METELLSVRDVMTSPPITVCRDVPAVEVMRCLLSAGIGGVPVVDGDALVGIVTESDLVLSVAYGKDDGRALALVAEIIQGHPAAWVDRVHAQTAGSLMTHTVVTVSPDDDVREAARRLLRRRCRMLPVVDAGRVVGVVSRRDLVRSLDADDPAYSQPDARSGRPSDPSEACRS